VLAHERVLEAIMERGPVLPLRFGTQLASEDELAAVLTERREGLLRALERVRGRVEIGLRVLNAAAERGTRHDGEPSGRDFLLGWVREHRDAERPARELHAPLAALAGEARLQERPAPPAMLVASYLVDEARVEPFRARVGELAGLRSDLDVVVTGPWPPYTFAGEGLE
jgi:Gas vesicle synthesis protein GvpL/GvpF